MFPQGSIQRMNSGRSGSTRSCMDDELIREFHEAGIYDYAQSLGIIQNDTIAIPNGLNVDDNCNSQPWQVTGEYSLPALSGIPAMYMGINVCPSVAFDSMESGSICSSSIHSDVVMATLASNNAMAGLNNVDTKGDEFESPGTPVGRRKRRRIHRTTIGEQGGRGLRHFSMKVCKKVESKGWTTYNEVASELVAEFVNPNSTLVSQDQQQYDEKNIRRRVYDALNVLMAMDIITKEKKEIHWKGLPIAHLNDIEQLKADQKEVITRIEKKRAYLQELEEQIAGLQNLVLRNEKVHMTGNNPSGGVALPFILVKTRPHATVDIEISEDMQLVHFDFNSTPFELHDDAFVLKAMQFCKTLCTSSVDEKAGNKFEFDNKCSPICTSSCYSTRISDTDSYSLSSIPGKLCNSPPVPVITKAHVKDENFN